MWQLTIPEIGHFALILALGVSLIQGIIPLVGAQQGRQEWLMLARPATQISFALLAIAFGVLTWSFYVNDFSVLYVAEHSNALLPTVYRIGAVWGGHEGSLLLWIFLLTGWAFAVAQLSKTLDEFMIARVLSVLGLIASGLLLFVLATSNPFERLLPAAQDGRSLNPLLQDPGLVFHPPMLYMGYVGFSVAFAFAIASLLSGKLDAAWARWSRPWTTTAWIFLTLGIALGSWWAYYELGWGGWWFWDPVENASFMPWLIGTALLHSLAVTEKRGGFKNWTVLLAIIAFSMSLLGTFLVRSGVLTSVHAFATDPRRGIFILILLTLVVGSSLLLYALRAPKSTLGGAFALMSRETFILLGNVFLVVASGSVLLGTLYPLLIDSLNLGKISVGPPYFNAVFVPIMIPVLFLLAVGPWANWKSTSLNQLVKRLWGAAVVAFVAAILIPRMMGEFTLLTGLGFLLSFWIIASGVLQIVRQVRVGKPTGSFIGMQLGHIGIAVFVIGVTMVGAYQEEKDVRMAPNDTVMVGGYQIRLIDVGPAQGPNYQATRGNFEVSRHGNVERILSPEKRNYDSSAMPMTEAAIDAGFTRDIYVSLGEPLDNHAWAVRVYYKPFVDWIWGGCLLMALGGLFAVMDKRYRLRIKN
ncbi:cytochrome c-type biogenesis protein CcmF [Polynucleobacter sphagniphilus]|jgi:cytochrome c-type biogenesis protein CcmF|uniref:Cytochrome c-type biogenesis protein CcmF n=1 Tax=Polynucleobacter sphagniphilus TaxID=1743169 RepID=A0AA43M821_9BURK|nr:heme lyase CcmF/NrfE family subunit [Polynucleobacter sphagniphilus]MDH6241407.1 cytochrome c-type biogenesis protein CcmF [Polynucleobacter sphagniphilus]MDH6249977.1 cytochrome c-type biogenesis protein CcmF [Polynucleobacter sphagniphilus]MDH6302299.1 cytochrome c-type biogenesis protein CcmF [Polynucleobacter sphagniphilus]MDH6421912.1 cytochrome c-type biogenesis protein CcmF [Polynucleobacter sphagniphilus]MDH6503911.1 cytochrome c-type biogenesis protein CcmF [Polynucleobacter sphagn